MPTFIRLSSLTEQGIKNIRNLRDMVAQAQDIMEAHAVELTQTWITLGEYDFVSIIEAPDAKTAAQVSALIGAKGNVRSTTLSAVALSEIGDAVERE